jgi:hypothetical protein
MKHANQHPNSIVMNQAGVGKGPFATNDWNAKYENVQIH